MSHPTAAPSASPSQIPTTSVPTLNPSTMDPTTSPTQSPIARPSFAPITTRPSSSPTLTPTVTPSISPSSTPTSAVPTFSPVESTAAASGAPSSQPTILESILLVLDRDSDMSLFIDAVENDQKVLDTFNKGGNTTIFPPTNAAVTRFFSQGGVWTTDILLNHFISGIYTSQDLQNVVRMTAWSGAQFDLDIEKALRHRQVRQSEKIVIIAYENSTLEKLNIVGTEGIAHTIDRVLESRSDVPTILDAENSTSSTDSTYLVVALICTFVSVLWCVIMLAVYKARKDNRKPDPLPFAAEIDPALSTPQKNGGMYRKQIKRYLLSTPTPAEYLQTPPPGYGWSRTPPPGYGLPNTPPPGYIWSPSDNGYIRIGSNQSPYASPSTDDYVQITGGIASGQQSPRNARNYLNVQPPMSPTDAYDLSWQASMADDGYVQLANSAATSPTNIHSLPTPVAGQTGSADSEYVVQGDGTTSVFVSRKLFQGPHYHPSPVRNPHPIQQQPSNRLNKVPLHYYPPQDMVTSTDTTQGGKPQLTRVNSKGRVLTSPVHPSVSGRK